MTDGSWVQLASFNRARAELVTSVAYPGGSLDASDTQCTVSWTLRVRKHTSDVSGSSFVDTFDWGLSGSHTASGERRFELRGPGAVTTVASGSFTVPLTYATQTVTLTGRVDPRALAGVMSVTHRQTIPARPFNLPAAPTAARATRVSDTRQTVTATIARSTSAPVTRVEVRRRAYNGGALDEWTTIASVPFASGSSFSYADTSTRSDRHYKYTVRTVNAAGGSAWVSGSPTENTWVDTTPATPAAPTAKKSASGITVTRPAISGVATHWEVWHAANGVWDAARLALVGAGTSSWVHASPNAAQTHTYRIRAVSSGPVLTSGYSVASATVQLIAPPLAPSSLAPTGAADAADPLTLSWRHNPVDTTDQQAYELRTRVVADPAGSWESTGKVASGQARHDVTPGSWENGTAREWQVRTWGEHPDPGAWSPVNVLQLSAKPVVAITTPGDVHTSSTLRATWSFFDPEGSPQARWFATLLDDAGTVLEPRSSNGSGRFVNFNTRLDDGGTYVVRVRAMDGHGVWSDEAEHTFTVDYALPPTPTVAATWHRDDGHATITVDVPAATGAEVEATHLQVWRSQRGGRVLVADDVAPGETVVDRIPPTNASVTYHAVSVSALPSTTDSLPAVVDTATRWLFLNYGPGFGQLVRLWGNLDVSRGAGREKVLHHFADREDAVEYGGAARTRTYAVSAVLFAPWAPPDMTSTWEDVEELGDALAPICLRDPEGTKMFVSTGQPSLANALKVHRQVSIPLTKVGWAEEVIP